MRNRENGKEEGATENGEVLPGGERLE